MIQVSDTAKRKSSIWWKRRFWRYRLRKVGGESGISGLSYDLKFDKAKSEDDKIFIDNEITIAVEKNLSFI
jgi:iron-sulfur cluster assembly protein